MRKEIVAAGFGGQGIILMGIIAATAAGVYDNKEVAQSQSFGPSARGGACRTDVIISDEKIDYAKSLKADVLLLMSEPAKEKYLADLGHEDVVVVIDSTLVKDIPEKYTNVFKIPATDIAEKEIGNISTANVVMLGAVCSLTKLITLEGVKSTLKEKFGNKPKILELNLKALDIGYQFGEKLKNN